MTLQQESKFDMMAETTTQRDSPIHLGKGDKTALALIGLEVHTRSQMKFLKRLKNHTFGIQIYNRDLT